MFTKQESSSASKSALVGVALSGLLFATAVNAASLGEKSGTKTTTSTRHSSSPKKYVSRRKKSKQRQSTASKTPPSKGRLSRTKQERPHRRAQSTRMLPLGPFTLRAYTHSTSKKAPARTATGTIPSSGRTIAVDPRVIPFGTKVYIEGLGERIAEDSGAKIKGRQLDVFLPTVERCRHFGVQTRDVEVMIK